MEWLGLIKQMDISNVIPIILFLLISSSVPTYFTKRKWDSEKEYGASGMALGEYARMWYWIWFATASVLGGLAALFFNP